MPNTPTQDAFAAKLAEALADPKRVEPNAPWLRGWGEHAALAWPGTNLVPQALLALNLLVGHDDLRDLLTEVDGMAAVVGEDEVNAQLGAVADQLDPAFAQAVADMLEEPPEETP